MALRRRLSTGLPFSEVYSVVAGGPLGEPSTLIHRRWTEKLLGHTAILNLKLSRRAPADEHFYVKQPASTLSAPSLRVLEQPSEQDEWVALREHPLHGYKMVANQAG